MLGYRDVIDIKDIYAKHFSIESPDRSSWRSHTIITRIEIHINSHPSDDITKIIISPCSNPSYRYLL
jgi:hypothetical protein